MNCESGKWKRFFGCSFVILQIFMFWKHTESYNYKMTAKNLAGLPSKAFIACG